MLPPSHATRHDQPGLHFKATISHQVEREGRGESNVIMQATKKKACSLETRRKRSRADFDVLLLGVSPRQP
jgi:hypothetical protein